MVQSPHSNRRLTSTKTTRTNQLAQQERYHLNALIETSFSVREIAKRLNRHHSAVYRELRRNSTEGVYTPEEAGQLSRKRRQQAEKAQIFSPERLKCRVNLLNRHWSPESISHPTITRWIAKDRAAGGQFYRRLWSYGRKRWKGGKRHRTGRDCIARRVDISERPEEVDYPIDDWKGDTMKGGATCFVTLTERFSRLFSARVLSARRRVR